jgi:hypothetical protein
MPHAADSRVKLSFVRLHGLPFPTEYAGRADALDTRWTWVALTRDLLGRPRQATVNPPLAAIRN